MIGVAVNEDRAINGADFGYLIALFIALYIIRGLVILTAYPVLRSVSVTVTTDIHPRLPVEDNYLPLLCLLRVARLNGISLSIGHSWE